MSRKGTQTMSIKHFNFIIVVVVVVVVVDQEYLGLKFFSMGFDEI